MRIAVTGAAGFVGRNLIDLLVTQGHDVVAIDRVHGGPADGVRRVAADILDAASMKRALEGVEVVYHLVAKITLAQHDDAAWTVNTSGVRTVAEAALAADVRRMVHCSSVHSYDQRTSVCDGRLDEAGPRSADPTLPVYDRSKWAGEQALREVIEAGLDAVVCNPTGIYGPADHGGSRINGMLRDAALGRVPAVVEGGFDLVDVRDVTRGLTAAAERGRTGENYLLPGHHLRMLDVFRLAARMAGRRGPLFAFPLRVVNPIVPLAERIGGRLGSDLVSEASMAALAAAPEVDGAKARDELGYRPRAAEQTVRDLVGHFVSSGRLDRGRMQC